jgi:oxygen-dependent protoporphyrinogen oxidase
MPRDARAAGYLIAMRIVIVGGGVTGLSAAYYCQQVIPGAHITVLESDARWGGKLVSERVETSAGVCLIEGGAESFVTRKPEAWALAHELGLGAQIVPAPNEARRIAVVRAGRALAAPLDPLAFLTSPLLSPRGKLRMLAEPFAPARADDGDESLAAFVDRRLGREAREFFVGPILAGIYNSDPERQSIMATAPVMRELERSGSLLRGALASARHKRGASERPPAFFSFRDGAQTLTNTLADTLKKRGADLRSGARARTLAQSGSTWLITLDAAPALAADAIMLTTPAGAAAGLLRDIAPQSAEGLRAIRQSTIGTLSLIFRTGDLPPARVRGVMIPRPERLPIDAITRIDAPHPRVVEGHSIIKVFFGGGDPKAAEHNDADALDIARGQLRALLGITASPMHWRRKRWLNDFPQADVGHLDRVAAIERHLPRGIVLAGASYRGIGVPDCVRQAHAAARAIAGMRVF